MFIPSTGTPAVWLSAASTPANHATVLYLQPTTGVGVSISSMIRIEVRILILAENEVKHEVEDE